jgi:hypothetical protein
LLIQGRYDHPAATSSEFLLTGLSPILSEVNGMTRAHRGFGVAGV